MSIAGWFVLKSPSISNAGRTTIWVEGPPLLLQYPSWLLLQRKVAPCFKTSHL